MREVTLNELEEIAKNSYDDIWSIAKSNGRDVKIYLHWTGMHYGQQFSDYHINIDEDGEIYVSTDDFSEKKNHTWLRNRGSIGIALDCAYGAGSSWLGEEPPTERQIEVMAQVIAVLAKTLNLPIDKYHVLTHGEAANNEDDDWSCHNPYSWWNDSYGDGDTRGDLEYLGTEDSPAYNPKATDGTRGGDVLRGKAQWYLDNGI